MKSLLVILLVAGGMVSAAEACVIYNPGNNTYTIDASGHFGG